MGRVEETLSILRTAAEKTDFALVAYSGGKDSLAVLDLCSRTFRRLSCFFMYMVPGLECCEQQLDYARARWGVEIVQYPHWVLAKALRNGAYCAPNFRIDEVTEDWTLRDVYNLALQESGAPLLATGAKRSDSLWRRRNMRNTEGWTDVVYPIAGWNKYDVLSYLKLRSIPVPDSHAGAATGIDLTRKSLLWLHDMHPADFDRLCEVFPYAEAVVWHRRWYGKDGA